MRLFRCNHGIVCVRACLLRLYGLQGTLRNGLVVKVRQRFLGLRPTLLFLRIIGLPICLGRRKVIVGFPFMFFCSNGYAFLFQFYNHFVVCRDDR